MSNNFFSNLVNSIASSLGGGDKNDKLIQGAQQREAAPNANDVDLTGFNDADLLIAGQYRDAAKLRNKLAADKEAAIKASNARAIKLDALREAAAKADRNLNAIKAKEIEAIEAELKAEIAYEQGVVAYANDANLEEQVKVDRAAMKARLLGIGTQTVEVVTEQISTTTVIESVPTADDLNSGNTTAAPGRPGINTPVIETGDGELPVVNG